MECVLIDFSRVTSVTASTSLTVDDCLGAQPDWCSVLKFIQDVESIGECACCALSPARTTVPRNMLIFIPRHVVSTVHVSPINLFGKYIYRDSLPRSRSLVDWTIRKACFLNSATFIGVFRYEIFVGRVVFRLREIVNSEVVIGIILFFFGRDVFQSFCPSVQRSTPVAA